MKVKTTLSISFFCGLLLASVQVAAEVVQFDGVAHQANTSLVEKAEYIQVEFKELSLPTGSVVLCGDFQMNAPNLSGREIELWPARGTELPWESLSPEVNSERQFGLVAGKDGFIRFDVTSSFEKWVSKLSGPPVFYLRIRQEEDNLAISPQEIQFAHLVLHILSPPMSVKDSTLK